MSDEDMSDSFRWSATIGGSEIVRLSQVGRETDETATIVTRHGRDGAADRHGSDSFRWSATIVTR
jgi:hypothetical protein